jgi:hypothetical protein
MTDRKLNDANIIDLSTLLREKVPMIKELSVRRNQFGNPGAE